MEKKNNSLIMAVVLLIITVCFTVMVCFVDRQPIAPDGSNVGFAALNGSFKEALGEPGTFSDLMDKLSDIIMLFSFLAAGSFVILGVAQLIQRKNILKVDKAILLLAAVYVISVVLYVVFDKVPINYRPILAPGETELETSFPSSHTLFICTIFGTAMVAWGKVFAEKKSLVSLLRIAAFVFIVLGVTSRILAGVHWITDIVAGMLYSATLIVCYTAVLDRIDS